MNIQHIYNIQSPLIKENMARVYNNFAKDVILNQDFSLSDDEMGEVFNEVILMHMREHMSYYEWTRIINEINK